MPARWKFGCVGAGGFWRAVWLQNGNFSNKRAIRATIILKMIFEARSRVRRLQLDAIASELSSGQVYFEIGKFIWGKAFSNPQGGGSAGRGSRHYQAEKGVHRLGCAQYQPQGAHMGIQAFRSPLISPWTARQF